MKTYRLKDLSREQVRALCRRNPPSDPELINTCREVFEAVAARGDEAVSEFGRKFDGVELADFRVCADDLAAARERVPAPAVEALEAAARNIRKFHSQQLRSEDPVEVQPGVTCWRASRAVQSVGLYIPGGQAILPSTVLMLGIPARLAGCPKVVMCAPPRGDGSAAPEILVAAQIAGIRQIYKIGGVQAIAALTFGTQTVPRVDKILGPGNRFVQAAKLLATWYGVSIDFVAGPTEVLIIADQSASPALVAGDLIAQAEHGDDSRVVLVTDTELLAKSVVGELRRQVSSLPRKETIKRSLAEGLVILTANLEEAFDFSNRYAPEHLILHLTEPHEWLGRILSAGSVFLGPWSPEVAGDYASGTNHTLPTSGMARSVSGVSLDSFVKKITFQELTEAGLKGLAPVLEILAELESLEGHRRSVQLRLTGKGTS